MGATHLKIEVNRDICWCDVTKNYPKYHFYTWGDHRQTTWFPFTIVGIYESTNLPPIANIKSETIILLLLLIITFVLPRRCVWFGCCTANCDSPVIQGRNITFTQTREWRSPKSSLLLIEMRRVNKTNFQSNQSATMRKGFNRRRWRLLGIPMNSKQTHYRIVYQSYGCLLHIFIIIVEESEERWCGASVKCVWICIDCISSHSHLLLHYLSPTNMFRSVRPAKDL